MLEVQFSCMLSQDDSTEMNLCKETATENPDQIYDGNNNEDYPSFPESKMADEAVPGK